MSLESLKRLIRKGARSLDFDLSVVTGRAREMEDLDAGFVEILIGVITGKSPPEVLAAFPEWD